LVENEGDGNLEEISSLDEEMRRKRGDLQLSGIYMFVVFVKGVEL